MASRFSLIALAVAAALPSVAPAVDFSYSGFSTAAFAKSDTDEAEVGLASSPKGIDSDGTFELDSKVGVQVSAKFNDIFSATLQGVGYSDMSGDWEPRLDWAYLRVQPLQNLSFRGGYLRAPTFMYSDSIFIGYANTWVRAPLEVYNLSPVYQIRGVDATWRGTVGAFSVTVNPYYGDSEVDLATSTVEVPKWAGISTTVGYGSVKATVSYSKVELETDSNAAAELTDALIGVPASMCGGCALAAQRLMIDGAKIETLDFGVEYDDGDNLVATEYALMDSNDHYLIPGLKAGYITYGRRFGNVMPYATLAGMRRDAETRTSLIPSTGPLVDLNAAVNGVIASTASDQDSYSVGVRYEIPAFSVLKAALVKLQFDHIDTDGGPGNLNKVQPGFDGKVNMISASFDFIF